MYMLSLQGPTTGGSNILESWVISEEIYLWLREQIGSHDTLAVAVVNADGQMVSQRFYEGEGPDVVTESDFPDGRG